MDTFSAQMASISLFARRFSTVFSDLSSKCVDPAATAGPHCLGLIRESHLEEVEAAFERASVRAHHLRRERNPKALPFLCTVMASFIQCLCVFLREKRMAFVNPHILSRGAPVHVVTKKNYLSFQSERVRFAH